MGDGGVEREVEGGSSYQQVRFKLKFPQTNYVGNASRGTPPRNARAGNASAARSLVWSVPRTLPRTLPHYYQNGRHNLGDALRVESPA